MIGSQYIHSNSETNDDKESSSDFEDSDDQEGKEDTIGLKKIIGNIWERFFMYLRLLPTDLFI